jgi:ATP-dependent exoDNAse (exonuclease V) beta subunit
MEFEAVFIPFMNNNYLPSKFKNQQVFDIQFFRDLTDAKDLTPAQLQKEHMAGEIRLFYNGLTRAKKYLYITSCKNRSSSVFFDKLKDCREKLEEKRPKSPESWTGTARGRDSCWMLKKKALVALYRQEMGLNTNTENTIGFIKELSSSCQPELGYGHSKVTENKNSPLEKIKRSYSATNLNTYRDCPFKYKIQHYFGIAGEESINLIIGMAYHEILQRFFKKDQDDFNWKRLKDITRKVLEGKDLEFPSMKRQIMDKAFSDFERYHEEYLPTEPSSSKMETDFKFDLDGNEMRGRIDQINIEHDGSIELVDFKSGTTRYSEHDLEDEIQLKIYRLAIDEDSRLRQLKVKDVKMKYLSLGSEKKAEFFLPDGFYDQEKLIKRLKEIISGIRREKFRAEPSGYNTCNYCDFKVLCPRFFGKYD